MIMFNPRVKFFILSLFFTSLFNGNKYFAFLDLEAWLVFYSDLWQFADRCNISKIDKNQAGEIYNSF